ncbi:hypothetical protein [Caulobacter sp. 17J80-11]|uniref:hypothetical protein n=1 Tax=Caulobacter sp. 17J80-11 TaxID=2763502 RepID=UPI001653D703|nr:hypothetical protein [Caulobacter sp. 17J80-11]MBC6981514.1 hypothetical protein [Caulobacter sp. 17J80-11]
MRNPVSFVLGAFGGTPRPEGDLLTVQSRPDQAGDRYRYACETEVRERSPKGAAARRGRHEILVEIVEVQPKGLLIARTLVAISGAEGGLGDGPNPYERAWVGVRAVFETDGRGFPLRVSNWSEARAQMLVNLRREAPGPSPDRAEVEAFMEQVSADAAIDLVGADLIALGGARSSGPVPAGREERPAERFQRPDGRRVKVTHTLENEAVGPGRVRCDRISRSDDGRQLIQTTTILCTETGWAIELESEQSETIAEAGYEHVQITRIRRLDETA